jgi:glycosyltransferase involved in cell wall biosynthesis
MRILLVNSERGFRGGEFQTAALADGLSERGFEVHLAAASGSRLAEEIGHRIPVHRFTFEGVPVWTPMLLGRLIGRIGADLVHAQTSRAHTHAWMAARFLRDAPPLVVSRRVAFSTSGGFLARMKYLSGVEHYIPISEAAAASLRSAGVPGKRMTIIPSGVNVSAFRDTSGDRSLLTRWGASGEGAIIGTVAAFEREKGLDVLMRAAAILLRARADCTFVVIGEGAERGYLEGMIERGGLGERVVLEAPGDRLEAVMPLFTVFVLPSLAEGMSTSLAAAMASGRAIVASRTGGIPEVVGEDGAVLVPPGDAEALAGAIGMLLSDPGRREMLARNASERAERFDMGRMVESTITLYRMLVGDRQARHLHHQG